MNIFKQFYYSLFDLKKIAEFRTSSFGKVFLFILVLVLFATIPRGIMDSIGIHQIKKDVAHYLSDPDNPLAIVDGELVVDLDEPVVATFAGTTILVDVSGDIAPEDVKRLYGADLAFLKDRTVVHTVVRVGGVAERTYEQTGLENMSRENVTSYINTFLAVSVFLFVIAIYLGTWIDIMVTMLILSIFGFLMAQMSGRMVRRFSSVWKMSAYAMSLVTLFLFVMDSLQIDILYRPYVVMFISSMMLLFAIREIPKKNADDEISF